MKEKILNYINSKQYTALDSKTLFDRLNLEDFSIFQKNINELINEHLIFESKRKKILSKKQAGFIIAQVVNFYNDNVFFKTDELDKDIRLKLNPQMINLRYLDIVLIKNTGLEYRFEKIIEHKLKKIIGEFNYFKVRGTKKPCFLPENKNFQLYFPVTKSDRRDLVAGHKVVFTLVDREQGPQAKLLEIIGHKNDPGIDIKTKIIESGAPINFRDKTILEIENTESEINIKDHKHRLDLRDKIIFTIDGEDAKDLDDAVEAHKLENGNYKLGVHISDVSHYVKEGSSLDLDAKDRGTSIYLADRVVPMYPYKLSNGICSLHENVDRLAISCYLEITPEGKVIKHSFHESIINSKKKFSYYEVNEILEKNNKKYIEKNQEFIETLYTLEKIAHTLRKERDLRGQLEFSIPESKIILNDLGEPIDILVRSQGEGEKLIEDCMIAVNEAAATSLSLLNIPTLYRIHEKPEMEKIFQFNEVVKSFNIKERINASVNLSNYLNNVLDKTKNETEKEVLSSLFLRSLPKAVYSPNNVGHYGLGSKKYTHFTAPIRRYPDTIVHRLIKKYIINQEYLNKKYDENFLLEKLKEDGETTSMQERRAIQLERDVDDMKKAEYMEKRIGEVYKGKVSGFVDRGMFIRLDNTVEGFLSYNELQDDFYKFDKDKFMVYGVMSKKNIKIGDSIKVVVSNANKETSKIDFSIFDKKRQGRKKNVTKKR